MKYLIIFTFIATTLLLEGCNGSSNNEQTYDSQKWFKKGGKVIRDKDAYSEYEEISDVLEFAEEKARFIGGKKAMFDHIQKHLVVPISVKDKKISGLVYVRFVIEKDGAISHPSVTKGLDKEADEAAKSVTMTMPNWQPARHQGQTVRVFKTIPITFNPKYY